MSKVIINETSFVVRISGRRDNSYYIDYQGSYKISDIAKLVKAGVTSLKEKYIANGAVYDKSLDIYYFRSVEDARKTISDLLKDMKYENKGRTVFLTEAEIEYIRRALINEGAGSLRLKSKIKDAIFNKLNQ